MPFSVETQKYKSCNIHKLNFFGELNYDDFLNFKKTFNSLLDGERKFGAIFVLNEVVYAPPNLIMEQATYMKEYESKAKIKLISSSIILESTIIKNLLNALFMIKKPIAPNFVTSELCEGEEYIKEHIDLYEFQNRKK